MKETIFSIIEWHTETFPDATEYGQRGKFKDEHAEYMKSYDLMELADMFIVACGVARFNAMASLPCFGAVNYFRYRSKWSEQDLGKAVDEKMAINRNRQWNKCDGKYQHVEE